MSPARDRQDVTAHAPARWEIDRRVPLATVLLLVGAILGGTLWVGNVENITSNNRERIEELELSQKIHNERLQTLVTQLAQAIVRLDGLTDGLKRIEGLLERLLYAEPAPKPEGNH